MNILHNLHAWWATIFHHAMSGTLPPAPTVESGPVAIPPAPSAPAPVVATADPKSMYYPAIDADGTIKPTAFDGTPIANYRCMIQDTYDQLGVSDEIKANLLSNFNENFGIRVLDNNSDPFALSGISEGHNYMVPRMQPSNNPPPYGDVLVFPSRNTANGWAGFHLADCEAFVARCKASGKWPKIDHTGVGAVA